MEIPKGTAYWVGFDICWLSSGWDGEHRESGRLLVCAEDAKGALDQVAEYLNGDILRLWNTKRCTFLVTSVNRFSTGDDVDSGLSMIAEAQSAKARLANKPRKNFKITGLVPDGHVGL